MHWTEHKAFQPSITIAKWILSLCVSYQLAVLTWLMIDRPVVVLPEPTQAQSEMAAMPQSYGLAKLDLFGSATQAPSAPQEEINAPKTRLRLLLMGVFVAAEKTQSSAIIAEQGRDGEFFRVGDRVQGRALLSQVYEDKVIIDNNGKFETLTFEESQKALQGITANKAPVKPSKKPAVNRKEFRKELMQVRTADQFVNFARQQLQNPQQAMKNLGVEPTDGGYIVSRSATMLLSIGMKPGDKLISVNGNQLGDPEQDRNLIDEVYASGNASLVVERGSRRMTINHSF
ncbi:type II secretion system protein GspC [Oceaniserpentilla sp. 4NH20-0058]|uniref:type II secretion system protein N n=1 Tax=Oceaniserpentilla sp. 4NH20-0058 TaxID=3127660 RepID=UPI003105BE9A